VKTLDQIRDEVAGMMGWHMNPDPEDRCWIDTQGVYLHEELNHPVPSDLGGIAAMMPEGWKWQVGNYGVKDSEAAAWRESAVDRHGTFGPTPVESLTRLLHAVLSAQAARTEVGRG